MNDVLVDSNVLIDVTAQEGVWRDWSIAALRMAADAGRLVVNPLIYAEVSVGFADREGLEALLPIDIYDREPLPWEAAFVAGRAFLDYRRRGGVRTAPLPDFYIGAHAAVRGYDLLTRDAGRYRGYFPSVRLIAPGEA